MSGDVQGQVTFEWMEGGFFLIRRVDLGHKDGQRIKSIEIIGHERPFGTEPSEDIKSRFYSNTGDTLDYVYELEGDILTIWAGEKGSPAYAKGTCSEDGNTGSGEWVYPGGGYRFTMTRTGQPHNPTGEQRHVPKVRDRLFTQLLSRLVFSEIRLSVA